MSDSFQYDELLTQSEILEKETLLPAKDADQHAEAEPDEAKHGQDLYQNGGEMAAAILLISQSAGVLANHNDTYEAFFGDSAPLTGAPVVCSCCVPPRGLLRLQKRI